MRWGGKPAIAVLETGAPPPGQLIANRQYIPLGEDRLQCVVELLGALSRHRVRRMQLQTSDEKIEDRIRDAVRNRNFEALYRVKLAGVDSEYKPCGVEH